MKKLFTISIFALFAPFLMAQSFEAIPLSANLLGAAISNDSCPNDAGTFHLGQFYGSSNDHQNIDAVYLCHQDSILVVHNLDYDLSGDPVPFTAPGIVYPFFTCPPTISGTTLLDLQQDNCRLGGASSPDYFVVGTDINFTAWFYNSGLLQSVFTGGKPADFYFSPTTIDDYLNNAFESAAGAPPGSCVNINTGQVLRIIYLNEIIVSNLSTGFGAANGCTGSFVLSGGLPEMDTTETYTITEFNLAGMPAVTGSFLSSPSQFKHGYLIEVTVPQAGLYTFNAVDSKNCKVATFALYFPDCITVTTKEEPLFDAKAITVSPNPFSNDLAINLPSATEGLQFHLLDVFGRPVMNTPLVAMQNSVPTNTIAPGMYFYHIEWKGKVLKSGKLIKRP